MTRSLDLNSWNLSYGLRFLNVRISDDRFCSEYLYSPYNYDNFLNIQSLLINGTSIVPEEYHCEEVSIKDVGTPRIYGAQVEINMPTREVQVDNACLTEWGFSFDILQNEDKVRPTQAYIGKGNSFESSELFGGVIYSIDSEIGPYIENYTVEASSGFFAPLGDYFVRVFYEDGSYGDANLVLYADPETRILAYADVKLNDEYGREINVIRIDAMKDSVGITYSAGYDDDSFIYDTNNLSNVSVLLKNGEEINVYDSGACSINEQYYRTDKYELPADLMGKYELKDFEAIKIGDVVISFGA